MLVVVTIIVLLMAFSTPALMRTMQATRLSSVGDSLLGSISEAQQMAFAQNVPLELRFYSYDSEFGDNPLFRAYQLFKVTTMNQGSAATAVTTETILPLGSLVRFSEGIVIADDDALSPGLSGDQLPDVKADGATPGYSGIDDATYAAIRFMPDGSCRKVGASQKANSVTQASLVFQTLPTSFFTITYDIGVAITAANLPPNFYTIQVDPFTGKARSYKPGF